MKGALLMAQDAALEVPSLDTALSRMRAGRAATTSLRYASLQVHKHLATP